MMEAMECLYQIMDWIRDTDTNLELHCGSWDFDNDTWYAVIKRRTNGDLLYGESTYGIDSIDEALKLLWKEIEETVKA